MISEIEVYVSQVSVGDSTYEIKVFARPDGRHIAKTIISQGDLVINDGASLDEALEVQRELLPLAIDSRRVVREHQQRGPARRLQN